jgi:hypothetical protein
MAGMNVKPSLRSLWVAGAFCRVLFTRLGVGEQELISHPTMPMKINAGRRTRTRDLLRLRFTLL